MRINRLDLLRYGFFTDVSLPFTKAGSDLHVIFGPNEAGKSTSLAAIEDLLFGIPHNSPYNFVHDYGVMRVGGVLEHDGKTLEFRRRKGYKDTLLAPDENPLLSGDSSLALFLGGADRTFLTRMFSLNHERLAQGGREILEAKDEVGQTLFSAGAGLSGLRDRMARLAKEADELWASRRAGRRKYYVALDALEEADKALREHTVTANKWLEAKRALNDVREAYEALERQIEEKAVEQRKLSRIRRVYRQVRRLAEVETEIAGLAESPSLPNDAESQLTSAMQQQSNAQSKIDELEDQLTRARSERADLQYDETLLMRSEEIGHLHTQRIEVHKEKADLPKRRAELAVKEQKLGDLAEDLDWDKADPAAVIARIPQRAKVTTVRTLLAQRGELVAAINGAQTALEETQEQIREFQEDLSGMEDALDISSLSAVIRATRDAADVGSRIKAAEKEFAEANNAVDKRLKLLRPQIARGQDLEAMPVPPRSVVQNHRDAQRDLEQKAQSCLERIGSAETAIGQLRRSYERLEHDEEAVGPFDLDRAREDRDAPLCQHQ